MSKKITDWFRFAVIAVWMGIFALQFVYAVGWAVQNGNNIQDFYDTAVYLQSAKEFAGDGWRLLGYACILRWFQWFESVMGSSYVILIYLVQALCSVASFGYGTKVIAKIIWNHDLSVKQSIVVAVYLVTLPVIWQMQFALLPDAFCLALLVLLFSQLLMILFRHKELRWERIWVVCGSSLLLGVLNHHYFYAGASLIILAVAVLLIKQIKRNYRSKAGLLAAILLMVVLCLTTLIRTQVNDSVTKTQPYAEHTMVTELWGRFVFPHMQEDYAFYPEEVKQAFSEDVLVSGSEYYELYLSEVVPQIEAEAGENAYGLCWDMVLSGFQLHRNEAVKSFIKESIAYGFMPFSMVKYMYKNGSSLYGHNVMKMWEMAPKFTVDYMHITMNGFLVICCLGLLMFLLELISAKKTFRHMLKVVLAGGIGIITAILPMMLFSVEKFDYRIGLFSVFIWGAVVVSLIMDQEWRKDNERKYDKDVES